MTDTDTDADPTEVVHLLKTEDAMRLVKRSERLKGARFCVAVSLPALVEGRPGVRLQEPLTGSVAISRADASKLLSKLLSPELEAQGGRIRVIERVHHSRLLGEATSFWIM